MINQQLYNAMFYRKSIRKYDMSPLPNETLVKIQEFADAVVPLESSIKYELTYLVTADVKNLLPIKAPHYVCIYSEKKEGYLMNSGFILQQIDLFLSMNNIGSCWLGMAKPSKDVPTTRNGLEFVIMLAFGNTAEPIHRSVRSEYKRKSIAEMTSILGADELLEPVRLAPSASNTQPWFFSGDMNEITVSREKLNLIKAPLYGKMNQIDIGIALCHLELSLGHQGKTGMYDFNKDNAPSKHEFMVKVKSKESF